MKNNYPNSSLNGNSFYFLLFYFILIYFPISGLHMFSIKIEKKVAASLLKTQVSKILKWGTCCPMTAALTTVLKWNNTQPQIIET